MQMKDYRTRDLYLAAFLKAAGIPFQGVDRISNRVIFIFDEGGPHVAKLKAEFFSRKGTVPALTYADEIKALKALIHS